MTQEQWDYEMGYGAQAAAEAEMEAEFWSYMHELLEGGKHDLYGLYLVRYMLYSKEYRNSNMSAIDYLTNKIDELERKDTPF